VSVSVVTIFNVTVSFHHDTVLLCSV